MHAYQRGLVVGVPALRTDKIREKSVTQWGVVGARTRGAKRLECYFGASDVQRFQHHGPIGDGEQDAPRHYVLDRATDVTLLFFVRL